MNTKIVGLASILILITLICLIRTPVPAQQSQQTDGYSSVDLRQMLAVQPDYTGIQHFIFSEGFGVFGGDSKVARLGNRMREEDENQIIIHERGKPSIRIIPGKRQYSEFTVDVHEGFAVEPEDLAKRDDVTFKLAGTDQVNGMKVLKVEAVYKDKKLEPIKITFYIAPELKNLVVRQEVNLGDKVGMITVLQEISLNVDKKLFEIPPGYKKVEDPYKDIK